MNHRTLARAAWPLAALACLALAACSGGNASEQPTPDEVTTDDLAAMLPGDALQVAGFQLNVDPTRFGVANRDVVLLDSFDAAGDEADMQNYGWQVDYRKWYTPSDPASGIEYVSTGVSLYGSPQGAAGDLVNQIEDLQAEIGQTNGLGARLLFVQGFVAGSVEGGRGMRVAFSLNDQTSHATVVRFVRGNIIGGVAISVFDDRDMSAETEALANQLANQIVTVLTGQSPTPVPTPAPTPVPTEAPSGSPAS